MCSGEDTGHINPDQFLSDYVTMFTSARRGRKTALFGVLSISTWKLREVVLEVQCRVYTHRNAIVIIVYGGVRGSPSFLWRLVSYGSLYITRRTTSESAKIRLHPDE